MKLSASLRRNPLWWFVMALILGAGLLLAGGSDRGGAPSDDRLFALSEQLKCLQCTGESVAGSQAPLAEQFRDEIRAQMADGATDDEILDYFVERYGQQVLLTPPSSGAGWLVWVLPLVLAGGAVVALAWVWPRWQSAEAASTEEVPPGEAMGGSVATVGSPGDPDEGSVADVAPVPASAGTPVPATSLRRRVVVVVSVLGFLVVIGALLVRGTGERDGSSSGAPVSSRDPLARCRTTAMQDPAGAIECYDRVLADDPENVEALGYRGWAHLRADDPTAAAADLDKAIELDPTYPDARVFRAIAATRAEDFDAAASELAAFFELDPDGFAVSVVESEGLERTVFFGRMSGPTAACWQQAAAAGGDSAVDKVFLQALGTCLDGVLGADPANRDARFSRAVAEAGPDGGNRVMATTLLGGLLSEDTDDADALSLLAVVQISEGDFDGAEDSITRLAELPRAPSAFLLGDVETLRATLQAARESG